MADDLEDAFVAHVKAIEDLCDTACERAPNLKETIEGHLETATAALDGIQDLLGEVGETAAREAEGEGIPGTPGAPASGAEGE